MLSRKPEFISEIHVRFGEALKPLWDTDELVRLAELHKQAGNTDYPRPGTSRVHVFDFMSGLRLVVSREIGKDDGLYFHVSVSYSSQGTAKLESLPQFKKLLKATLLALKIDVADAKKQTLVGNVFHLVFDAEYSNRLCERYGVETSQTQTD